MKRNLFLTLVCFLLAITSCGKWRPIVVDKDELTFGKDGGTQTVTIVKNYTGWQIYSVVNLETKKSFPPKDYFYAEVDGLSAKVEKNTLIVTVEPSETRHEWSIHMGCGDAFTEITVYQE